MKKVICLLVMVTCGCEERTMTTDMKQSLEQSKALSEAHAQVGMPAIGDFSEKRMMKDLYELRDKPFPTHSYLVNEMAGCLVYLGPSIGYGLPYATQYTAPERDIYYTTSSSYHHNIPQPEPNGLYMPAAAEGTWLMLKAPGAEKVQPVYVEPRVLVSPFRLPDAECKKHEAAVLPEQTDKKHGK